MFLLIGVIIHTAGFALRYASAGYTPVTNLFENPAVGDKDFAFER